jgi:hypothetical protein
MKPLVSLPCSQKPTTSPYPEPEESSRHIPTLFCKKRFNLILPFMPRSSWWFSFAFVAMNIYKMTSTKSVGMYIIYFYTNIHVHISIVSSIIWEKRRIKFPEILLQAFRHYAHRNVGSGNHVMTFASHKPFELVDVGHMRLNGNTASLYCPPSVSI